MLNKDDMNFLKRLKEEMVNQETDSQASPRFWVIRDYEWVDTGDRYYDRISVYIPRDCENYELYDFIENIEEYYGMLSEELIKEARLLNSAVVTLTQNQKEDVCLDWIRNNLEAEIIYESHIPSIVPNTFFLTKREAKEHIKANHYHYSDRVHTYAMSAWRSPQVERLYKIIEGTNWDE